jgi:hypothetical protein
MKLSSRGEQKGLLKAKAVTRVAAEREEEGRRREKGEEGEEEEDGGLWEEEWSNQRVRSEKEASA